MENDIEKENEEDLFGSQSILVRRRRPRTTARQHEAFIEYAKKNKAVLDSLHGDYAAAWTGLVHILNSQGPTRTKSEWKDNLKSWEYQVKSRKRQIVSIIDATGGGPPLNKKLSQLEERALAVFGKVTVQGDFKVPQLGFSVSAETDADRPMATSPSQMVVSEPAEINAQFSSEGDAGRPMATSTPPSRRQPHSISVKEQGLEALADVLRQSMEERKDMQIKKQESFAALAKAITRIGDAVVLLAEKLTSK